MGKLWDKFIGRDKSKYEEFAPISGGDKFDTDLSLKVQDKINKNTMLNETQGLNTNALNKVVEQLRKLTKKFVKDYVLDPYWLMLIHGQYFTGILKYHCSNKTITGLIEQVKKCAFLYGKAAIFTFYDPDLGIKKTGAFYIHKIHKDIFGNVVYAELGSLSDAVANQSLGYRARRVIKVKTQEDLMNLHIFNWGVNSLSAWIWLYPFVNFQFIMNQMLVIQSLAYNKKFIYNVSNTVNIGKELEAFYDPCNPLIINIGGMEEIMNRFTTIEGTGGESARDFIMFYKEYCDIWYQFIGRRSNVDFKKERSITTEIDASQDAIDSVQKDVLIHFDLFINELKNDPILNLGLELKTFNEKTTEDEIINESSEL